MAAISSCSRTSRSARSRWQRTCRATRRSGERMSSIAVVGSDEDAPLAAAEAAPTRVRRRRPLRLRVHSLLRWLHIYTSMVSLLVVLFFAATGVTLNHPDWLAGERTEEVTGKLPATWKTAKGIDWLVVAEHLRTANGVHGTVADRREDDREGSLTFRAPGYSADAFIDVRDGSYKLTTSYQGAVGVLNDLHRGRDAGSAWAWLIDASGSFLV